jgi:hypothetical protein
MSIPSHVGKGLVEKGPHNRKDLVMSTHQNENARKAFRNEYTSGKDLVISITSEENARNAPNSVKTEQLCCLAVEGEVAQWF